MSKAARLLALCLLAFGMAYSHAANFSKNTSSYLQVQGNTAKYTLSPQNTGALQFPNTGWQVVGNALASGLTIGKTQNLPIPAGASLPASVSAVVSPKSLAKSLVNPWSFVASMALQETLGYLATQACVRLADGVMINTGGLWEECRVGNELQVVYQCNKSTGGLFESTDPKTAADTCLPVGKTVGNTTYVRFLSLNLNVCGSKCHSAIYETKDNYGFVSTQSVMQLYETEKIWETKKWFPSTPEVAQSKIEEELKNATSIQVPIFNDLYQNGVVFEDVGPVTVSGPQSVNAGEPVTMTKTNPDGSVETSTQQFVRNYSYAGDTVTHVSTTTVNVTNNNGQITTSTNTTPNDSPAGEPQEVKLETCGLPGKPPCKIDETGTPEAPAFDPSLVDSVFQPIKTCLENPLGCLPALPELTWAFTVPTSCTAIPVSGFGEYISEIDICPFQSIFHDLMSMIWAAVGVFAAAQMLFRDSAGSA